MTAYESIKFIDPSTGEYYDVVPRPETVDLARRLGYLPASSEDMDKVDAVDAGA